MRTYRVAILGCRARGTAAARAYHAHPRTEVVALCDLLAERRAALGDELGVSPRFDDLDEMIRQTSPDIVAIPTGTEFHYELAMRVLEHGVDIDIEKPLCVDLEQADQVVARAAEMKARIAVHHQGRTGANMRAVKQLLQQGRLGEPRYLHATGKNYYGGYGLMNIGTHQLNNMLAIAGHARRLTATAQTDGRAITPGDVVPSPQGMGTIAGEDLTATLHFDGGVIGTLRQHRFPGSLRPVLEIVGTEGRLLCTECLLIKGGVWFLPQPTYVPDGAQDAWQSVAPLIPDHYPDDTQATVDDYCFVDDYVRALDAGGEHECSGAEAHHIVEIMMGIFEAAAFGSQVALPLPQRQHPLRRWRSEHGLGEPAAMPRPYAEWLQAEDQRLGRG